MTDLPHTSPETERIKNMKNIKAYSDKDLGSELEDWKDQRVTVTGTFDRFGLGGKTSVPFKTALLLEAKVTHEGKDVLFDHIWVQHANRLQAEQPDLGHGDKIECTCRVGSSKFKDFTVGDDGLMIRNRYSLTLPEAIRIISRMPRIEGLQASASSPVAPVSMKPDITLLTEIQRAARELGGTTALLDTVRRVESLVGKCGGFAELRQWSELLQMLAADKN